MRLSFRKGIVDATAPLVQGNSDGYHHATEKVAATSCSDSTATLVEVIVLLSTVYVHGQ